MYTNVYQNMCRVYNIFHSLLNIYNFTWTWSKHFSKIAMECASTGIQDTVNNNSILKSYTNLV